MNCIKSPEKFAAFEWMDAEHTSVDSEVQVSIKKTGRAPERTHHRAPSEGSVPCSRVPDWHQRTFQLLFNKQGLNWEPSASQLSPLQMETWSMERKVKYKLTVRAFGKTRVQIFNAQCAHLHSSSWLSCSVDLIFPSKRSSAETRWEAAQ